MPDFTTVATGLALSRRPGRDARRQRHPGRDRRRADHPRDAGRQQADGGRPRRRPERAGDRPGRQALLLQQWRLQLARRQWLSSPRTAPPPTIPAAGSSGSTSPPARSRRSTSMAISAASCAGPTTSSSTRMAASGSPITARSARATATSTGIFYAKADGSHLEEVIFPSENPNGIGLSPDGTTLYAAETYTCRLMAFNVDRAGQGRRRRRAGRPRHPALPAGRLQILRLAGRGGERQYLRRDDRRMRHLSVISPAGELVEFVPTPDIFTTNICWGGADLRTAYITLSGTGWLVSMPWPRPGVKLKH